MRKKMLASTFVITASLGAGVFAMNEINNLNSKVKSEIDNQIKIIETNYPHIDIEYDEIMVNLDKSVDVNNIKLVSKSSPEAINIGDLKVHKYDYENKHPHFFDIQLNSVISEKFLSDNLNSTPEEKKQILDIFNDIKGEKDDLHLNFKVYQDYNNELKINDQNFEVEVDNAFKYKTKIVFENFDYQNINSILDKSKEQNAQTNNLQMELAQKLGEIKLSKLYFEIENTGIIKAFLNAYTKKTGLSENEIKMQLEKELFGQSFKGVPKDKVNNYSKTLNSFLFDDNYNTIYLKFSPQFESLKEGFHFIMNSFMSAQIDQNKALNEIEEKLNIEFDVK